MVKEEKIKRVKELADLIKKYRVVGIIDIYGLPSDPFQQIRKELRGKAIIKVEKKSILERAIRGANKSNLEKLLELEVKMPAILLTDDNPFRLFKLLKKKRTPTFAKPGERAEREIVVPAGPTGLPPGPIISDLKSVGIKASIQGQDIVVQEDCKLLDPGDVIDEKVANVLMKLGIKASSIGLKLVGAWEDGVVYTQDVLDVSAEEYENDIIEAVQKAFNLAYNTDYPAREVVELKLVEAAQHAFNLAYNAVIYEKEVIEMLLQKAQFEAVALNEAVENKNDKGGS